MAATFLDLQNGFYNALSQGLGFPPGSPFQLLQPSNPLPVGTPNPTLWNYFNNIPPFSLTQNYIASGGNQFFSDYKGLLSALQGTPNTFESDVGPDCYGAWQTYVQKIIPLPAPSQLPQLFFNWASIFYPSVANVGAADLSQGVLDPIVSAQNEITWVYANQPPDWSLGYSDLVTQLANAPSRHFQVSSSTMNSNVSNSWTQGSNSGFFGLWGGSSSTSTQSTQFAASGVSLDASFAHVLTAVASPGNWYSSAAMGDAFSHQSGPPWNPKSMITWQNTFDANNGNMARFAVNLIVVDTMTVRVTSLATFSQEDQQTIHNNQGAGMWPFYSSGSNSSSYTDVTFNTQGQMTVHITSHQGVPVVIGCNVLPVAQYVGHAVVAARILRDMRAAA